MTAMTLAALLPESTDALQPITGVAIDSRRVQAGDLFLAVPGHDGKHGLDYLQQALAHGAVAVAYDPAGARALPGASVPMVAVPGLGACAGELASRFYGQPSQSLFCVGITGTDGKTSTAYLLAQALDALAQPCAYIGTIGVGRVGRLQTATHTTPDAASLHRTLAQMRAQGAQAAALEVSSHALDQDRVAGVDFDVAVLTNITRDHLDYHGTLEAYIAAKRKLFERAEVKTVVLNQDDPQGRQWALSLPARAQRIVYGIDGEPCSAHYVIGRDLDLTPHGMTLTADTHCGRVTLHSPLLGRFNAYNLLAVLAVLLARGVDLEHAARALAQLSTVPGRIEGFRGARAQPLVVVDYAHTPDALAQILQAVRAHCQGQLIAVFGCGGDRDTGKRPLMGAVAAQLADAVIVTDDNPRSEAPQAITDAIVAGIALDARARVQVIHDRAEAIARAVARAQANDVVVVAGKGHETTQTYGAEVRAFSDRAFVAELLGSEVAA
ncbi:UDP-N-acetylmuramoyl-L-alanyl-D-glutamate--2,6-diaminopimelate ligase [Sinimarinibacterium sp. NLF-5-8]|uniref:UDP-N-acetylmuramoyl-L-alanyl-D-glutamate--2, 6-diaminopimelate ligase n=1 Tax=Sinimarinibacterium sp. NLF-5-8 TaxID=2698684 RepID=UPI00137BAA88|nr:UDP-N-acetylmuramoyl-L-alanyl-D-glutamate--2,6-diaminopimelate ligase [Sinimarinibacterium sp. NLF-5-8]QHS10266.1 UDP-N-acetylmuramoyl-L-alanyl-D-glutamate--2,6-diaminopimelate ligase [Sinimarinibacterium sp. NLF-5-8]